MAEPRVERRLAAIMAADVVGYSRLIERDEAGTLARLKAQRQEFMEPILGRHGGRIVKLMGDGALVEFGSVVDAVQAAVEFSRRSRSTRWNGTRKSASGSASASISATSSSRPTATSMATE